MARTINLLAHAARRDAFIDAAIRLIQAEGYERLSVQAVIEAVGSSKGAFFHYFDSKGALLAAVVERNVETAMSTVAPIAVDPGLTALEKLQGVFVGLYQWKRAQPEFQKAAVAALMRTWFSDENTIVVERMRAAAGLRLTPLFEAILRQGAAEGAFSLASPEGTASVLTSLSLGLSERAVQLFLGRQDDSVSYETATCTLAAYFDAIERILGIAPTVWPFLDEATARFWFG